MYVIYISIFLMPRLMHILYPQFEKKDDLIVEPIDL